MSKPNKKPADAVAPAMTSEQINRNVIALALVRPVEKSGNASDSRALDDPWNFAESTYGAISPPLDPIGLALLEETSSELGQCLTAYEINIPGFGWRIKPLPAAVEASKTDEVFAAKVLAEKEHFKDLLDYIDYDSQSFTKLRRNTRRELEQSGNAYWEIIRSADGKICSFRMIPHTTMRIRPKIEEPVLVKQKRPRGHGAERTIRTVTLDHRFRTFVQARFAGTAPIQVTYFKEYGDPRDISAETGEIEESLSKGQLATEVIHHRIYNSRSVYGMPRYTGNLLAIFGSRKSEEINFTTFTNNNIPSLALLVSNGEVTPETVTRIKEFTETQIQGQDNYSKILIIEAMGEPGDDEGSDNAKLELKPLVREQHTDQLFQEYDKNNREKVRQSMRLPPIFTGQSSDYNRATAETSRALADEQVFHPERSEDDHLINRVLLDEGMVHNAFVTNTPNVTNDQNLIAVMNNAEKTGGMTPRIAREILEDVLNRELPDFPEGFNPDLPFSLSMAEAVKNLGQASEPGQQVTALKRDEVDEGWYGRVMSAVKMRLSEGDGEPATSLAMNVGSQAQDIADGVQLALVSPLSLRLNGRDMHVSDGHVIFAKVRFGEVKRLSLAHAATASGIDLDDLRGMFPGKLELYTTEILARDKIEPVAYEKAEDSLFTVIVNA